MVTTACPYCGIELQIPEKYIGQQGRCKHCSQVFTAQPMPEETVLYTMKGVGGLLEVHRDKLTITPKGVLGFMSKGLKGTKTIPFFSISGIQFKTSGLTSGYLQFTIAGGNESKGGIFAAVSDENTFMFDGQNGLASEIKDYIEKGMQESRNPQASLSSSSIADELQKLADMKSNGILSEEEFQSAKQRIIG